MSEKAGYDYDEAKPVDPDNLRGVITRLRGISETLRRATEQLEDKTLPIRIPPGPEVSKLESIPRDIRQQAPLTEELEQVYGELAVTNNRLEAVLYRIDL